MVSATVTLYKDIGLDSNYNRTMLFDTKTQQNNWFSTIPSANRTTLTDVNYNKLQNSFAIHDEIGDVYGYSYVRIQDLDDSGRIYYGFISNVTLIDEETTRFDIVLDPIQTFMCEWELGNCLVVKEHCDRWGSGDEPIRITPDSAGITANMKAFHTEPATPGGPNVGIIIFTSDRAYALGEDRQADDRIYYGICPLSAQESLYNTSLNGQVHYTVATSGDDVTTTFRYPSMEEFCNGNIAKTLGILPEQVLGAYIVPKVSLGFVTNDNQDLWAVGSWPDVEYTADGIQYVPLGIWTADGELPAEDKLAIQLFDVNTVIEAFQECNLYSNWNDPKPDKPTNGDTADYTHEPALFMSPYTQRYLCNGLGAVIGVIPDAVGVTATQVKMYTNLKSSGVQNIFLVGDNLDKGETGANGAVFMDEGTLVDIMNDEWYTYCRTQRDSDRKMMWSSIASNIINQAVFMGYGGALVGSRSNSGRNDPMKGGDVDFGGTMGNLAGAMGRAMGWGVAASLVTSAVQGIDMWVQQEAKEQSIRNQPAQMLYLTDGIAKMYNDAYILATMRVDDATFNTAYDKFTKFGYTVNRIEVPDIKSRKYFNYICTSNTTVKGSLPADIKQSLVSIFEKGITFFHADYCSDTEYPAYENIERALIS